MDLIIRNNEIVGYTGCVVDNSNEINEDMFYSASNNAFDLQSDTASAKYINFENEPTPENISTLRTDFIVFKEKGKTEIVEIPVKITRIGAEAFSHCRTLVSVTLGNQIKSIGNWAFRDCNALSSVNILNGVNSLGEHAFSYCISLESITIPGSIKKIGYSSFFNCVSLKSVTILNGVNCIDGNAFENCKSLQEIAIPDSVVKIGECAFRHTHPSLISSKGSYADGYARIFNYNVSRVVHEKEDQPTLGESKSKGTLNVDEIVSENKELRNKVKKLTAQNKELQEQIKNLKQAIDNLSAFFQEK